MRNGCIVLFAVIVGLAFAGSACADDNVRSVQEKLRDGDFYSGEIDGAYSSQLAAALTRYQIRKGLAVTGQLDVETSEALDAKPAVGPSTAATEQSSETWRGLRKRERRTSNKARQSEPAPSETSSPADNETPPTGTETPQQTTPVAKVRTLTETTGPAPAPPAAARSSSETTEPASVPPATVRASSDSTRAG